MTVVWYLAIDKKTGLELFREPHESWIYLELKKRNIKRKDIEVRKIGTHWW